MANNTLLELPIEAVEQRMAQARLPGNLVRLNKDFLEARERIRGEQYKPERERVEIAAATARLIDGIVEQVRLNDEQAAGIRDRVLGEIDRDDERARQVPLRATTESPDEYQGRMARLQVSEHRNTQQINMALADASLAASITDLPTLQDLLEEAFDSRHVERIRRVGRAVQLRLQALEGVQASAMFVGVKTRMDSWRQAQSAASPNTAREKARDEFEIARSSMREAAIGAAGVVGLSEIVRDRLTGEQFATGMLVSGQR